VLARRIQLLVGFTIAYNAVEGVVALAAGSVANSAALIGFGLDSLIEMSSALVVAWQFFGGRHEQREQRALRGVAVSFFALAGFVTVSAVSSLLTGRAPDPSTVGIVIAALSLLVMPTVSLAQRRAGAELGSGSAVADSKQTLLCSYMSGVLLLALLANSLAGWWWADALGALAIAALAVREGMIAWRGDSCCTPLPVTTDMPAEAGHQPAVAACGSACTCTPAPRATLRVGASRPRIEQR
jgi:hypothetical protein